VQKVITRQSRRPQSAPRPKARYRGGRAQTGNGDVTAFGSADAIALARRAAKEN